MTEWKVEVCGADEPRALELVSPDTYIQRRDIRHVFNYEAEIAEDGEGTGIPEHWECVSRFITVAEYNNLKSIEEFRADEAIDAYTMSLIEGGIL